MHYLALILAFVTGIVGGSTVTYFRDRLSQFAKELTTRLFDWLDKVATGGGKASMFTVAICCMLLMTAYSCHGQNGPTPPSATLNWTQSTNSGVSSNCVYRGTASGAYALPALFCSSAPITSYKDSAVTRGTDYFYAVTARLSSGAETPYSNEVKATPPVLNPPTGLGATILTLIAVPKTGVETASADGRLRVTVR